MDDDALQVFLHQLIFDALFQEFLNVLNYPQLLSNRSNFKILIKLSNFFLKLRYKCIIELFTFLIKNTLLVKQPHIILN